MAFAVGVAKYVPAPNERQEVVQAYAHCPDARCKGVIQEKISAVKTTVEWTIASRGGGDDPGGVGNIFLPIIENSQSHLRFLMDGRNEQGAPDASFQNDVPCPHCDTPRELSSSPRPSYPVQVGGPNALLRMQELGLGFDPDRQREIQQGAPETPLELLQRRFINDEIDEAAFNAKRIAISGGAGTAPAIATVETDDERDKRIEQMQEQINQLLGLVTAPPAAEPAAKRSAKRPPAGGTED